MKMPRSLTFAGLPALLVGLLIALPAAPSVLAQGPNYQIQGNYNPGPMPSQYQQINHGSRPTATIPQHQQSLYPPAMQYQYAPAPQNYAAYQQLPYQQPAPAPKPKATPKPAPQAAPTPAPQPAGAYSPFSPNEPMPYPPAPLPAPKPDQKPKGDVNQLAADVAQLKQNDAVQDRRLAYLEGQRPANVPVNNVPSYKRHEVRIGESLWGIADRYKTTPEELRRVNRLPSNIINVGDQLLVPDRAAPKSAPQGSIASKTKSAPAPGGSHIVQRGESLSSIAAAYHISLKSLQSANKIQNANLIRQGQKLTIPGGARSSANVTSSTPPAASKKKSSDTTTSPSQRFVSNPPKPTTNETVAIAPSNASTAKPASFKGPRGITSYRVEPGDTIDSVAKSLGTTTSDIQRLNRLSGSKLPPVGDEIAVPLPGAVAL